MFCIVYATVLSLHGDAPLALARASLCAALGWLLGRWPGAWLARTLAGWRAGTDAAEERSTP